MRRLSRRLSERTRLKSITSLLVGVGLATGMMAAQGGSLLEPGTTTYLYSLQSDVPLEIGEAHTLVLDTGGEFFDLDAPLINRGVVHLLNPWSYDSQAFGVSDRPQVNQGHWIIDGQIRFYMEGGLNNQGGVLQIGANSTVYSTVGTISGGRIHGMADTSALSVYDLRDVTISGQVNLVPWTPLQGNLTPRAVRGTLTVEGTLGIQAMNLSESTLLRGSGQTILKDGAIGAAPGAVAPQLTIEAGHTLSGTGQITNVAVLNQGTIEVDRSDVLRTDSVIVQQGDEARLVVKGNLQTPGIQIQAGVLDLHNTSYVKGDVDVQAGRLMLHQFSGLDPDSIGLGAIIDGDLTLSDQSTVEVIVGNGHPFATVEVWGNLFLDGDLIVSFVDGAKPPSTFDLIFVASSMQGTFRSLRVNGTGDLTWTLTRISDNQFTITAVPEPGTWGLMLCGLGVISWRLRRRVALQPTH